MICHSITISPIAFTKELLYYDFNRHVNFCRHRERKNTMQVSQLNKHKKAHQLKRQRDFIRFQMGMISPAVLFAASIRTDPDDQALEWNADEHDYSEDLFEEFGRATLANNREDNQHGWDDDDFHDDRLCPEFDDEPYDVRMSGLGLGDEISTRDYEDDPRFDHPFLDRNGPSQSDFMIHDAVTINPNTSPFVSD